MRSKLRDLEDVDVCRHAPDSRCVYIAEHHVVTTAGKIEVEKTDSSQVKGVESWCCSTAPSSSGHCHGLLAARSVPSGIPLQNPAALVAIVVEHPAWSPGVFHAATHFVDRNVDEGRGDSVAIECGAERISYGKLPNAPTVSDPHCDNSACSLSSALP
jgi:hypothetical protein